MEQARDRVIGAAGGPRFSAPYMEPSVDVYETDHEVVVVLEVAGIRAEDVELEVEGCTLSVRGERKSAREGPKREYRQIEIPCGPFQRELLLPADVNPDAAQTVYKDGMLQVSLPKASPAHTRRVRLPVI